MKDNNLELPTYKSPVDLRAHARSLLQGYVADHAPMQQPAEEDNDIASPLQLEDVWSIDDWADGELQWQDDNDTTVIVKAPIMSRRALFGLPDVVDMPESSVVVQKRHKIKRRHAHMAAAGIVGIASTFIIGQILSSDESVASIAPNVTVVDTTTAPVTTPHTAETTVVATTLTPTSTTIEATTTTTLVPETTVAVVVEVPSTTVPVEIALPIPVSVYDTLDCTQATMIVQSGMTFSEIAEHCGMTMSRLQSYNPSVDPNHFITGTKLNLQMPAGANAVNDNPKDCSAIGGAETVVQLGFTPIEYLKNLGLSEASVNRLVYDKGILEKFGLVTVIAGTKECLPTRSAIKTLYGL